MNDHILQLLKAIQNPGNFYPQEITVYLVEKTVNFSNTAIILVLLADEIRWLSILCVILYISALKFQRGLKFTYEGGCRRKHEDLNCLEAMFSLQNRSLSVYASSLKEWVTEGKSEPV